jgi:hypothetical protein
MPNVQYMEPSSKKKWINSTVLLLKNSCAFGVFCIQKKKKKRGHLSRSPITPKTWVTSPATASLCPVIAPCHLAFRTSSGGHKSPLHSQEQTGRATLQKSCKVASSIAAPARCSIGVPSPQKGAWRAPGTPLSHSAQPRQSPTREEGVHRAGKPRPARAGRMGVEGAGGSGRPPARPAATAAAAAPRAPGLGSDAARSTAGTRGGRVPNTSALRAAAAAAARARLSASGTSSSRGHGAAWARAGEGTAREGTGGKR